MVDASAAGAKTETYLGPGADSFTGSAFADYVTAGTLAPIGTMGDSGPDQVTTGPGPDSLVVRLGNAVDAHLGKGADGLSFGSVNGGPASRFDLGAGRAARRIVLHGNRVRNEFHAHGCDVVLKGAAGDDVLSLHIPKADLNPDVRNCSPESLRAYGNAGDDRLEGWRRDDVLIGGPGRDVALGAGGRDRCEAERTQRCER